MSMKDNIKAGVSRGSEMLAKLLKEKLDQIAEAAADAYADHDGEREFSFPISAQIKLTPRSDTTKTTAKISFGVKWTVEAEPVEINVNQLELELEAETRNELADAELLVLAEGVLIGMETVRVTDLQRSARLNSDDAKRAMELLTDAGKVEYYESGDYRVL